MQAHQYDYTETLTSETEQPDITPRIVALLRLPGMQTVAYTTPTVQKNNGASESNSSHTAFLYAPFGEGASETLMLPQETTVSAASELIKNISDTLPHISPPKNTTPEEYFNNAKKLLSALQDGELTKAILSKIIRRDLPAGFSPIQLFEVLCEKHPAATIHVLAIEGREIWLGASPELLLDIADNNLFTVSLASTLPLNQKTPEAVTWGEKEIEEQAIVTRHVADVLRKNTSVYDVEQGETYTVAAGNVAHLKTEFRARIRDGFERQTLLTELHPTPAIGGWPRDLAQQAIEQFESHERSYYGGYFGVVGAEETHLYLNLRCVRITAKHMQLYVGGGYTAQSDPQIEWEETEHKAKTLLSVIENL